MHKIEWFELLLAPHRFSDKEFRKGALMNGLSYVVKVEVWLSSSWDVNALMRMVQMVEEIIKWWVWSWVTYLGRLSPINMFKLA